MDKVNGVRYITIEDPKIYKLLKEKDALVQQVRTLQGNIDETAKEGDKLAAKIQKIKDKSKPLMEKRAKEVELGEWEIVTLFQVEADEVQIQVLDQIEAEKDRIRDAKLKQDVK